MIMPGHLGVEIVGKGVGVKALGEERRPCEMTVGPCGRLRHADGVVVERGAHRGASAKLPEATKEPRSATEFVFAMLSGDAALFDVGDQDVAAIDGVDELFARVILPRHHEPGGAGMRTLERLLNGNGGGADGYVARDAALLKGLHVVERAVAEEVTLMFVEGCCEPGKGGVSRVEPAWPFEAVPGVGLHDDVGSWHMFGEVVGHDAPEAGQDGCDAE